MFAFMAQSASGSVYDRRLGARRMDGDEKVRRDRFEKRIERDLTEQCAGGCIAVRRHRRRAIEADLLPRGSLG